LHTQKNNNLLDRTRACRAKSVNVTQKITIYEPRARILATKHNTTSVRKSSCTSDAAARWVILSH